MLILCRNQPLTANRQPLHALRARDYSEEVGKRVILSERSGIHAARLVTSGSFNEHS